MLEFTHYSEANEGWKWEFFSPKEMACQGTGRLIVHPDFMDRLSTLRALVNKPLIVSSGYRSPEHNAAVGGAVSSAHLTGRAVDLKCHGKVAYLVLKHAMTCGFTGVGVSQKGPHRSRFIHLDDLPATENVFRPTVWSY